MTRRILPEDFDAHAVTAREWLTELVPWTRIGSFCFGLGAASMGFVAGYLLRGCV